MWRRFRMAGGVPFVHDPVVANYEQCFRATGGEVVLKLVELLRGETFFLWGDQFPFEGDGSLTMEKSGGRAKRAAP